YMGFDTLEPFIEWCAPQAEKEGKGIFVLLCTSNPGRDDIEKLELTKGGLVLNNVGNQLMKIAERFGATENAASPVGAVVGATAEEDARALRDAYNNIFFLIPGYGAQGGAARICGTLLDKAGGTVNSSRGILCAWKKDETLAEKREAGILTLDDIAESAGRAAAFSKTDILNAKASL
ncbi:MAG: orotidine 5'-phosphate decarboxylase, partial [Treponemataceae bacterium]|nr:orotidine 5'-phosphate decarboxylase [Treponemataceae bacterium]